MVHCGSYVEEQSKTNAEESRDGRGSELCGRGEGRERLSRPVGRQAAGGWRQEQNDSRVRSLNEDPESLDSLTIVVRRVKLDKGREGQY
jgi:hypothetical protein